MKLILDCDPGHDDAIAILLAFVFADLRGVTTVAGNCHVDVTTRNAEVACRVFGFSGEIVAGAARPLVGELAAVAATEPFSALTDIDRAGQRPPVVRTDTDATGFIVERADPETWLIATGPLTNVAMALRRDPTLVHRLAGISIMGGSSSVGNVTPVAEFNVWTDPEAAHIVLGSGLPLRLCGLDVTHEVLVDKDFLQRLAGLGTPCGIFVARLLEIFIDTYPDAFVGEPHAPLHDPCAVLAVTHPDLFEWRAAHVAVELKGSLTRGMTVIDQRDTASRAAPNVQVARACDRDTILARIYEAVESLGSRLPVPTSVASRAACGPSR